MTGLEVRQQMAGLESRQLDQPFCLRNEALCLDKSLFLRLASNSRSLGDSYARSDTFWIFLFRGGRF